MNNLRPLVATAGVAFVIALGAIAGGSANAANPIVGLGSAANYSILAGAPAITHTGATTIDRDAPAPVVGVQSLPSTSTDEPLGPLTLLGVALTGLGMLLLLRPIRHP